MGTKKVGDETVPCGCKDCHFCQDTIEIPPDVISLMADDPTLYVVARGHNALGSDIVVRDREGEDFLLLRENCEVAVLVFTT